MLPLPLAGPFLLQHALGGPGERRHGPDAALVGERVAALAGDLAVGDGLLAGLREPDERDAAETEFTAASADDEALDPVSGPGRLLDGQPGR